MKVKFAILGCSRIAHRHARHIQNHPEAELMGEYDIAPDRAMELCDKYGGQVMPSLESLLDLEVDVINVCTPNGLHCEGAIAVMNHGKHVLVEKPMALNVSDCERMIEVSMKTNQRLFVIKQTRYNPPIQLLKEMLNSHSLGTIFFVQTNCFWNRNQQYYLESAWRGTKELDGGTLFTQFSHFVDLMYYLFGDITNISGFIDNSNHAGLIEFEDSGLFNFRFKNGALGSFNYTTSCYGQNMEGSITIFAEKATLKIGGQFLNKIDYLQTHEDTVKKYPDLEKLMHMSSYYEGSMSYHDKVIDNVVQTLNSRDTMMTNAIEGLKVVDMIERMYAATR